MNYTIDAQNKKLGRVATEAAKILMGKNTVGYKPNVVTDAKVTIINASKADINSKKLKEDTYTRYTGFPGGLYTLEMEKVVAKKGFGELFKIAIKGMLPKNKLQSRMLKNLTITE
jgi:large subunit ribosomal protein L13